MNKNNYSRTGKSRQYNKEEDGLSSYNFNYLNAYKRDHIDKKIEQNYYERYES